MFILLESSKHNQNSKQKASTILKTLERASEEVAAAFEEMSMKFMSNMDNFIIEVRDKVVGCGSINLKQS